MVKNLTAITQSKFEIREGLFPDSSDLLINGKVVGNILIGPNSLEQDKMVLNVLKNIPQLVQHSEILRDSLKKDESGFLYNIVNNLLNSL
ncbi:MAG: hypothetical protein ACRCU6_02135 [Fusobacteriaceae bacterium]